VSEGCPAHRLAGYIDVGDGKARADGEGEIGEVALLRTLLAREVEPPGRFLGSIVEVGVVESVGIWRCAGEAVFAGPRPIDGFAGRTIGLLQIPA
jgi:hypothetical protein